MARLCTALAAEAQAAQDPLVGLAVLADATLTGTSPCGPCRTPGCCAPPGSRPWRSCNAEVAVAVLCPRSWLRAVLAFFYLSTRAQSPCASACRRRPASSELLTPPVRGHMRSRELGSPATTSSAFCPHHRTGPTVDQSSSRSTRWTRSWIAYRRLERSRRARMPRSASRSKRSMPVCVCLWVLEACVGLLSAVAPPCAQPAID